MIVLDTHIWIWWVHGDNKLSQTAIAAIKANESDVIGISAMSCWEIAKLVEYDRLKLPCEISEWFTKALSYPAVQLLDLTKHKETNLLITLDKSLCGLDMLNC